MRDEQNPNTSDISKNATKSTETEIKENKSTILDDKKIPEADEIKKEKIPWFESNPAKLLFAIIAIISFTSLIYEYLVIPKRSYEDKQKIQKLEQENTYLKDTSELLAALKENQKLQKENTDLLKNKEYATNLALKNKQLENSLEQWKKSYQTWQEFQRQINHNLSVCNNNFNIQKEINKLREKIEKNNRDIRDSGFYGYNPSEVKYKILEQDNIQLNNMILKYQDKIQCDSTTP